MYAVGGEGLVGFSAYPFKKSPIQGSFFDLRQGAENIISPFSIGLPWETTLTTLTRNTNFTEIIDTNCFSREG